MPYASSRGFPLKLRSVAFDKSVDIAVGAVFLETVTEAERRRCGVISIREEEKRKE